MMVCIHPHFVFVIVIVVLSTFIHASPVHATGLVDADFTVVPNGDTLRVTAVLKGLPSQGCHLRFRDVGAGRKGLSRRIHGLNARGVDGAGVLIEPLAPGLFRLQSPPSDVTIEYSLKPDEIPWDHHFPTITEAFATIPTAYLIPEAFADRECTRIMYGTVRMGLSGLPEGWRILTTCRDAGNGWYEIHGESVIHAGRYETRRITWGEASLTIAITEGLGHGAPSAMDQAEAIIGHILDVLGPCRAKDALLAVNPIPRVRGAYAFGGQAIDGNVFMYVDTLGGSGRKRNLFLGHFAHEAFHLWLPGSFGLAEDIYWFTEGFTRYQQYRIQRDLGYIDDAGFMGFLAEEYAWFSGIQDGSGVSLSDIRGDVFGSSSSRALNYSKGAIVAFLFDRELMARGDGRGINGFLARLRRLDERSETGLTQSVVLETMSDYLGDGGFVQKWILGASPITPLDLPGLGPHMFKARMRVLAYRYGNPPKPVRVGLVVLLAFGVILLLRFRND